MSLLTRALRASARAAGCSDPRRGFTLVELLVSIFVLSVGLLALTGASAAAARQIGGGAQLTLAATTAQSRFEIMRSRECATLGGGASRQGGVTERWSVVRAGSVVEVTDTVTVAGRLGHSVHAFRTAFPCPRQLSVP